MINTIFRKHIAITLFLTLTLGSTLIALRAFACPILDLTYRDKHGNILGGTVGVCL